jgi:hypothetical protein
MFSQFSLFSSKSESQQNTQNTIIRQSSYSRMLALRFTIVLRMLTTMGATLAYHKELTDSNNPLINNKYVPFISDFLMMLCIVGDLIDLIHTFREEKKCVHSVKQELEKNPLAEWGASSNPDPLLVTSRHVPYPYQSVQWKIGEKQLYTHITYMIDTFNYLDKYNIDGLPKTPQQFKLLYNLLPFQRPNFDIPTKTRLLNWTVGGLGYNAGKYLADFFDLSTTAKFVLSVGCAALTVVSIAVESYHLNQIKLELNLEGFSYKYEQNYPKNRIPKTCVGTQITRKILLYPSNRNFKSLLNYIAEGEIKIRKLLADNKLPNDAQKKLSHFKFFLKEKNDELVETRFGMVASAAKCPSF